jgi:hypothetical protein
MSYNQFLWATLIWAVLVFAVYALTGWKNILNCYKMWFTREYWKLYNIVEAASWLAKAVIIVPGLVFNIQIWWLYFFTLSTSLTLIWSSNEKLLPTLVGFNTLWTWLSLAVIIQHII